MLEIFREIGPWGPAWLVVTALACVACFAAVVGWALGRRVPPGLPLFFLAMAAMLPIAGGGWGLQEAYSGLARAAPEMQPRMVASGVVVPLGLSTLTCYGLGAVAGVFAGVAGVVAASRGPRGWVAPVLASLMGLAVLIAATLACVSTEQLPLRPLPLLILLLPVVAGLSSRPPPEGGPSGALSGAAAAMAYGMMVVLLELGARTQDLSLVFFAIANASLEMKPKMLLNGVEVAVAGSIWTWGAVTAAVGIAMVGVLNALEERRPLQNAGVALGLMAVIVVVATLIYDPCLQAVFLLLEAMR